MFPAFFRVALYFGIITCAAGFLGVGIGSESARRLRKKYPRADPLVCAFGLISCAPFLFLVMYVAKYNTTATWVSESESCLCGILVHELVQTLSWL